jgi:AraC-like DNA-binding protein
MHAIQPYLVLAYIDEGEGKFDLDSANVRVTEGELYVFPVPQQRDFTVLGHQGKQPPRVIYRLVDTVSLGMAAPLLPMKWNICRRHRDEMKQLLQSMTGVSPGSEKDSGSERTPLWTRFMEFLLSEPFKAKLQTIGNDELPIRQALHVMGHRFMNPISVAEISRLVAMSSRHFQRMFKSITGRTFIQMLQEVRIRHSCGLLQFSRLSVQTVAESVGIYDMNYFYRLFRSYCDMTPAAFRQHYQRAGAI